MGFKDDVIYCFLLMISIPIGHYVKTLDSPKKKAHISALVGLLMVIFVCRIDFLHSLIVASINGLIVCYLKPRVCHIVSFVWCFGYIVFFRTTHYLGLPQVLPHSNAVQLLLTLKMVGLAFEVHDTANMKKSAESPDAEEKTKLKYEYQKVAPSFTDVILYSYCYIGLLTGPYYKYRTYYDMMIHKNVQYIDTYQPMLNRLRRVPFYISAYLVGTYLFTLEYVKEEEFFERHFLYRFMYMVVMFFIFRMRLYIAWVLSECLCMSAALGAYPTNSRPRCGLGPVDFVKLRDTEKMAPNAVVYDFETIHNINEYGCEFAPTVREGMRAWNMSVQFWLANHVYKRVNVKSNGIRVAITMLVSAFWHGIHPGYYLSFLTIPPTTMAEDLMIAAFRKDASPKFQRIFDWFCWFFKMRSLDYMCMGFILLTYHDTVMYWSSIYYICHIYTFLFIAIGYYNQHSNSKRLITDDSIVTVVKDGVVVNRNPVINGSKNTKQSAATEQNVTCKENGLKED